MSDWKPRCLWHKRGEGFSVEVSLHYVDAQYGQGENRWCVYVYVFPKHPYFSKFKGTDIFQEATESMPLHAGCSYLRYEGDGESISAVKVGCDYNHLHDDHFTHYATKNDAWEVFYDANTLFDWMEKAK